MINIFGHHGMYVTFVTVFYMETVCSQFLLRHISKYFCPNAARKIAESEKVYLGDQQKGKLQYARQTILAQLSYNVP
jgi:hypothetical protein